MTTVVISQPMLFPWPGFFEQLSLADVYVHLDDVQFSKGSFTNRIQVKSGDTRQWMTIPLAGKGSFQRISDLHAQPSTWRTAHRDLLRRTLKGAPFLSDAIDILDAAYLHGSVCDILIASIDLSAAYLGTQPSRVVARSSQLRIDGTSWQRVLDIVKHFGGDRYLTGHGAARYMDHDAFEHANVQVEYMAYSMTKWAQFGESSTPYVTVLDLIAHHGPDSASFLKPATVCWRDFLGVRTSKDGAERRAAEGAMEKDTCG